MGLAGRSQAPSLVMQRGARRTPATRAAYCSGVSTLQSDRITEGLQQNRQIHIGEKQNLHNDGLPGGLRQRAQAVAPDRHHRNATSCPRYSGSVAT